MAPGSFWNFYITLELFLITHLFQSSESSERWVSQRKIRNVIIIHCHCSKVSFLMSQVLILCIAFEMKRRFKLAWGFLPSLFCLYQFLVITENLSLREKCYLKKWVGFTTHIHKKIDSKSSISINLFSTQ